jgi:trimethylamine--corrinoid protein Co-methyltransferase
MKVEKRPRFNNPITLFSDIEIKKIHEASLEILQTLGVRFHSERVLKLFEERGAKVDFDKEVVRIDEEMVENCLAEVPGSFSYYTQNMEELRIGEGDFYCVSTVDNSAMIDLETRKVRDGRLRDVADAALLMNELPFHHLCGNAVIAHDVPPEMGIILSAVELFKNNRKNCIVVVTNKTEAIYILELAQAVAGPAVDISEKPIISVSIAPSSPLSFPEDSCDIIWEFAARKHPVIIVQAPMPGASSPVTIAGTMAMANAESLSAIVLSQLLNSGNPVVYGGAAVHFDMRFSNPAYGAVEYGKLSIATAQMGRHYGLPTYGAGGATNANICDAQCGYEKMSSTMLAYLAGHDMLCDAGLNANALISLEGILIQDEILGKVTSLSRGTDFNEETLAIDVIKDAFESGDFISHMHTLKHMKTDFTYDSLIGSREIYESWSSRGGLDLEQEAVNRVREILENSSVEPLSDEVMKAIDGIVRSAKRELMP